jgi:tetratricopeptide (TPR) repeat protein
VEWRKQTVVKLIAREFPTGWFENWAKCQQLLSHIESLQDAKPATDESLKEWIWILTNSAWYTAIKGSYTAAHYSAVGAFAALERTLGQNDRLALISVNNIASVLQGQGKYDEAEKLSRRALEGYKKELGNQPYSTPTSVGNLAGVLRRQGKYDEAEKLNRPALEGREGAGCTASFYAD